MKFTKGMFIYFLFWILYIPFAITITLLQNYSLDKFFIGIGLGALVLLVFLSFRLAFMVLRSPPSLKAKEVVFSSKNVTPNPLDTFRAFRLIFGGTR